jgi:predicted carbohydrate-binding protein with CBM5 and CBM33 domain
MTHPSAVILSDDRQRAQADRIPQDHRGRRVMWSAWHRTFTAFGCFVRAAGGR